jgi:hypothetical protein
MSELRIKSMELAVASLQKEQDVVDLATRIHNWLNESAVPQPSPSSESSTTQPAAAPRKKRSSGAAPSTSDASAATEPASSTSDAASTAAAPSAAAAPAPAKASASGTSPASSTPTKDDVRDALTAYQTKCQGDIVKPREILTKYAPSGTLGTLKEEDYAKLIAELQAAK